MGVEIERKFLVCGEGWRAADHVVCVQGYLSLDKRRTVRVRMAGEQAWLTVKGLTRGCSRPEFEYPVAAADARRMLDLCKRPLIEKRRFRVPHAGKTWEVDEFLGANEGLVVAEIELQSIDEAFEMPPWVAEEVTDDPRYANSTLCRRPFKTWRPLVYPSLSRRRYPCVD